MIHCMSFFVKNLVIFNYFCHYFVDTSLGTWYNYTYEEVMVVSIVKHKDKRTGVTYVYESESYWDKEKKQPRSKRTLLGKIDEETGEIVPTGKSGRKKSNPPQKKEDTGPAITDQINLLSEKDAQIAALKAENSALIKEKQEILNTLSILIKKLAD